MEIDGERMKTISFLGWSGLICAPIAAYFTNPPNINLSIGYASGMYALIALVGAGALFLIKDSDGKR